MDEHQQGIRKRIRPRERVRGAPCGEGTVEEGRVGVPPTGTPTDVESPSPRMASGRLFLDDH